MKTFCADLSKYNEMDLENVANAARMVLVDAFLHEAGKAPWDYTKITPAEAQEEMSGVLTAVAAERKRRTNPPKPVDLDEIEDG